MPRRPRGDISSTESQLESGIAFNERLSKFSGWAVLAGLGIEIVLASVYHAHASFVENWGPVFATVLIALGVFGEIHFAGKVSKSEERLRQISDEKVAEATENAAKAHERAATLEKEAAEARGRTAEIERLTQWRRVLPEQVTAIVQEIRQKIPRNVVVTIECVNDPEAVMFADQLGDLLMKAGTGHVDRFARPMPADGRLEFGLLISSEPEVYAIIVTDAFNNAGIPITKWATAFGGNPRMTLYVGHKPEYRQNI